MKWRNKLGFTLIEVLVASMIVGLMLPPLGAAFYNFVKVPPEKTDELTVINEVHQVAQWLVDDGTKSTYYYDIGGEFWRKTAEGKLEFVAGYDLEDDGTLIRYTWTDPTNPTSEVAVNIAQHITNLDFEYMPTYLKVYIESTIEGIGGQTQDSGTVFVFLKSGPPAQLTYTIFCQGDISVSGNSNMFDGNVYSGGTVWLTGGGGGVGNVINGTLEAWDLRVTGGNAYPERVDWTEQDFPPIWMPEQFSDWYTGPYFTDFGDSLNGNLADGVYYSNSTVTVGAHTTGHVSIIAPAIKISGSEISLTAYYGGMLLWATEGDPSGQKAIDMRPEGGYFEGFIYAPEGTVSISSQGGSVIYGSIIAQAVDMSSNTWIIKH